MPLLLYSDWRLVGTMRCSGLVRSRCVVCGHAAVRVRIVLPAPVLPCRLSLALVVKLLRRLLRDWPMVELWPLLCAELSAAMTCWP